MKVLNVALIRRSEENAVKSGVFSFERLMYIAGNTAAEEIQKTTDCQGKKIAVICGNGNNGGDGFVVAKRLYEYGSEVTVILPCGEPVTENARFYYNELCGTVNVKNSFEDKYDIIIDAVFGIGLNRTLSSNLCELFEKVNLSKAIKFAIDIPSGVIADTGEVLSNAIAADYTITFIAYKPCFFLPKGSDYCGKVILADIGVKTEKFSYSVIDKPVFAKRPHNCHKGDFGTAIIMCGSYGMAGAAILSSRAALRSGLGIAKCVVCEGIYQAFTGAVPEAVCVPVKQNENGRFKKDYIDIDSLLLKADALLFGCGVGNDNDTLEILEEIIKKSKIPVVLDADGINALSNSIDILKKKKSPIIVTPHPAEMARLCNISVSEVQQNRVAVAKSFAEKYNCVVVLKGADTIVASPNGEVFFNPTGNAGMATGGSGDVLAGITVSLLAQGYSLLEAAKTAVYLHGAAGDKALAKRNERSMLPSDIIEEL